MQTKTKLICSGTRSCQIEFLVLKHNSLIIFALSDVHCLLLVIINIFNSTMYATYINTKTIAFEYQKLDLT